MRPYALAAAIGLLSLTLNGCKDDPVCNELTCEDFEVECGVHDDGCGGELVCECDLPFHECIEGVFVCIAQTCDSLGRDCGDWDDGCGGITECGPCEAQGLTTSLTQFGITWTFEHETPYVLGPEVFGSGLLTVDVSRFRMSDGPPMQCKI